MNLYKDSFYHFYNRSNNRELLFKERDNYIYFLRKYRFHLDEHLETIAYCLMPTHFHFLIKIISEDIPELKSKVGTLQSSYTRGINKRFRRQGSLFQKHAKLKLVDDQNYFVNLVTYIHQNPLRANLVGKQEDWEFSSFQDYTDLRKGSLPSKKLILSKFESPKSYYNFSQKIISDVKAKFWVN